MSLFKRIFGHERDAAGKSLDRLVLTIIVAGVLIGLYACHARAEETKYVEMPKLLLEQLCESNDPGCRVFIGGVAGSLYYAAKGTICFPKTESNGLTTINLDPLIASAKAEMSNMAFDQDMAAALFIVWRKAYPCSK
jgi:hypothetical protein